MLTVILVVAMASFASAQQPPPAQTPSTGRAGRAVAALVRVILSGLASALL